MYYVVLIVYYVLFIIHNLLFIQYAVLVISYCLLCIMYYLLFIIFRLLSSSLQAAHMRGGRRGQRPRRRACKGERKHPRTPVGQRIR